MGRAIDLWHTRLVSSDMALPLSECKVHPSVYHSQLNSLTLSHNGERKCLGEKKLKFGVKSR